MKLRSFRVTNFRSIQDSGWIEASRVTALIGTNESGKSNVLLALWKLKPARDGELSLIADVPRTNYIEVRHSSEKPIFIQARFEPQDAVKDVVGHLTNSAVEEFKYVEAFRRLDGTKYIKFPDSKNADYVVATPVIECMNECRHQVDQISVSGNEESALL